MKKLKNISELYPETLEGDNLDCAEWIMYLLNCNQDEMVVFLDNLLTGDKEEIGCDIFKQNMLKRIFNLFHFDYKHTLLGEGVIN